MKKLLITLIVLGLLGSGGYIGYKKYIYNKVQEEETKQVIKTLNEGTAYIYSEEEKEKLKEIGYDRAEEFNKYTHSKKAPNTAVMERYTAGYMKAFDDLNLEEEKINIENHFSLGSNAQQAMDELTIKMYNRSIVKAENVFNEDLSLKNVEKYTGFVEVDFDKDWYESIVGYLFGRYYNTDKFESFVKALKVLDERYKDEDGTALRGLRYTLDLYQLNPNATPHKNGLYTGAYFITGKHFLDDLEKDLSSMHYLQNVLKLYSLTNYFGQNILISENTEGPNVNTVFMPEEYNYFSEDLNYIAAFYPSKVEKVDATHYLITLESEAPLTPSAAGFIEGLVIQLFTKGEGIGAIFDTSVKNKNFDLTVEIIHKDLTSGMLCEATMSNVTNPYYYNGQIGWDIVNFDTWYPNEEAQKWIQEYFSVARKAYDEDSRFSIFETIKNVAKENNANYNDVESVIMTYYYLKAWAR